ncbi:MAG: polyribonucleotide nucleotidyltransferase [Candidatus Liptonbacteria bacterium]|nr:polyribonucleotide nucleotidyltransferase [Candidatus Liptonbacteria bacterium]
MPIQRKTFTTEVAGKTLTVEHSSLADQANAAVIVKYGETIVLATVVMSHKDADTDYLPLKVDYEEKFYAAGKILGSRFVRREGRASEEAVLAGRLVDRAIRPLFDNRIRREIQVVVTVLEIDGENDPEFLGLLGASTALGISNVPWGGPVAGVRLAKIGNELKINPSNSEVAASKAVFDAFVAGSKDTINMIELGGDDAPEQEVVSGFRVAQKEINALIDFQNKIIREIGKPKTEIALFEFDPALKAAIEKFLENRLEEAIYQPNKVEYLGKLGALKDSLLAYITEHFQEPNLKAVDALFEEQINTLVHKNVLEKEKRPDGRKLDQLRALNGEIGLFPRTHGSAVFIRGNTQALGITTLDAPGAEQLIETMERTEKRRFLLHYNFPPYSVGEVGSFRGPGRRDIGHGNLARKAIVPLIPDKEQFPYTIRVVSEILSSNGSSSMATVCATVMSLMDAGVPIKKPAAGIAMGLMVDGKEQRAKGKEPNYKVLTDIQGPEDHHGDMDLKVAGTEDGINALQMDVKVDGLSIEMLEDAFRQAKKARLEILQFIKSVIAEPKPKLSKYVPAIKIIKISTEKIGALIGPGGKIINGLVKKYGLSAIDIDDDGSVFISGTDVDSVEAAVAEATAITKEFKVGEIVEGNVIKIMDFGAIVDLGGGWDGMVHISELKNGYVKTVDEVLKMGDHVRAKIVRVEEGRIGLSIKQLQ